jgi:hypothetical protein
VTPGEPPAPGVASDLEGALREYLPPGTSLPEARRAGVQGYDPAHDALFDGHPRLRRAVIEYRTGREAVRRFGALRFPPCTDPRAATRASPPESGSGRWASGPSSASHARPCAAHAGHGTSC